jgi:hypothetical protein
LIFAEEVFMAERTTVLGSRYSVSKILSQIEWTGDVKTIAIGHETNRQSVVKTLFVYLFLMSKHEMLPGLISVGAASSQYLSATEENQAAHCVPGQLCHNGTEIQKLLGLSETLEVTLDCLFGATDDIHSNFNKADSSAEDSGLRDAFGQACNQVVQAGRFAKFGRAWQFLPQIERAFEIYKRLGITSFDTAILRQRAKQAEGKDTDPASRTERIFILQTYLNKLRTASNSIDTVLGLDPEEVWREVRE